MTNSMTMMMMMMMAPRDWSTNNAKKRRRCLDDDFLSRRWCPIQKTKRKKGTAFGYGASSSSSSSFFSADSFAHAWSKIFSLRRSFRATRRRFAETAAVPDALAAAASSSDVVKSSAMEVAE